MYGTLTPTKLTSKESLPTISEIVESGNESQEQHRQVPLLMQHGKTLLATVSAALGAMTLGATIGYTSPAVPNLNSHPNAFHLSHHEIAWVAGIISIGGILGEPFGGVSVDRFGRRTTLILSAVPFVIGWVLVASAQNVALLYLGRFITGLCSGVMDVVVPVYIAELAEKNVRGFMCSCHELATNMGYLFVFTLGIFLPWNWLAIACAFLPTFMLLSMIWMPESPRWLISRGYREEAVLALTWLRGSNVDITPELMDIEENVRASGSKMHWRELGQPVILRPLAIIVTLMFCQQFSGYGAIPEYLVMIFQSAGVTWNPYTLTAIVGLVGVIANFISALVVDKIGRRGMLLVSAILMLVSIGTLGGFFTAATYAQGFEPAMHQWIPTIALMAYNFGVALGYGPIPFYMASELFPLRARGLAGGAAISSVWIFMFVTSFAFPHVIELLHEWAVYWILTGFTCVGVFVALFVVPETKGKSLEAIENEFKKN